MVESKEKLIQDMIKAYQNGMDDDAFFDAMSEASARYKTLEAERKTKEEEEAKRKVALQQAKEELVQAYQHYYQALYQRALSENEHQMIIRNIDALSMNSKYHNLFSFWPFDVI